MKAIILAAGLGTRLRPLTNSIPKCLVPIKGQSLLEIWLNRLSAAGFGPFLINTHYMADYVQKKISSSEFQKSVTLVSEQTLLGTAGTLIKNLDFYQKEDGLLIHGDNYCLADFEDFRRAHIQRPQECLMTMMTFRSDKPSDCGIVEVDENGIVIGFHEKTTNPPGNLANGAIYILSATLMRYIEINFSSVSDFSTEVLPHLIGRIYTYETSEVLLDIGTIENYKKANS